MSNRTIAKAAFCAAAVALLAGANAAAQPADGARAASPSPSEQSQSEEQRLAEARRLDSRAATLYGQRKYADAIPLAEQVVEIHREILGEASADYASSLNKLGVLHFFAGDYAQAEPLYKRSLEIRRQVLDEDDPDYAVGLNNLALLYDRMRDYARAEPLYRQLLELRGRIDGEKHPDYAATLNALAAVYRKQGKYEQAEPLYLQAVEIRKEALGEHHADFATSLNNLALLYFNMGQYARAEPLYQQASEIWKQALGADDPMYALSLNNLAVLYKSMGKFSQAERLYLETLEIRKRVLGEDHPDYANTLNGLAVLCHARGDYKRAETLFQQGLEILKQAVGQEHPSYALSLNNLADLYCSLGDYARAEPLYQQALAIRKQALGEEHPDYATTLNNLAILYRGMGDYVRAESLFQQALEIRKRALGEEHPDYASSLDELAALYCNMREYVRAEPLYQQALKIRERALTTEHPAYATSLNGLAMFYEVQGELERAEPLFQEAYDIYVKVYGENHLNCAISLNNLAFLSVSTGRYAEAETLLRRALAIYEDVLGEHHPFYAEAQNNLAGLYERMGDYAGAEPLYRQALATARDGLDTASLAQPQRQQLAMGQTYRYYLDTYLSLGVTSGDFATEIFAEVLSWKGSTLVRQRGLRLAAADPAVNELFASLQDVARRLATLSRSTPESSDQEAALHGQLEELTLQKERLEVEIVRRSADFRQASDPPTLANLVAALPDNTVLVDYLEFRRTQFPKDGTGNETIRRELVAFVIRKADRLEDQVTMFELGPAEPVARAIDTWRRSYGISAEGKSAGQLLRATLWEPLLPLLGDQQTTVLVSTDGALGRLPLGALPGKKVATYLLEDHRLAMIPVPQLLPALLDGDNQQAYESTMLLMGDVDYDAQPDTQLVDRSTEGDEPSQSAAPQRGSGQLFGRLPNTDGEIDAIGELLERLLQPPAGAVVRLSGTSATEERFRQAAPQCSYLHLATHGFFAPPEFKSADAAGSNDSRSGALRGSLIGENELVLGYAPGLLSGLAFTGANREAAGEGDDGILTAAEIAVLPLDGVKLVTLSACETGLGQSAGGEGLLGLQRAFQVSGARATISSYWSVNDLATRVLMQRFYRNLWEGKMSKLDALREAQLYFLHHPDELLQEPGTDRAARLLLDEQPRSASPALWAAFALAGDWR